MKCSIIHQGRSLVLKSKWFVKCCSSKMDEHHPSSARLNNTCQKQESDILVDWQIWCRNSKVHFHSYNNGLLLVVLLSSKSVCTSIHRRTKSEMGQKPHDVHSFCSWCDDIWSSSGVCCRDKAKLKASSGAFQRVGLQHLMDNVNVNSTVWICFRTECLLDNMDSI